MLINSLSYRAWRAKWRTGEPLNPFFLRFDTVLRVFQQSGRSMRFNDRKAPAGQHRIGKSELREQLRGILDQAAIALFTRTEQVLDAMEWTFDICPHAGPQLLKLFHQAPQFVVGQRITSGALYGYVPSHRFTGVFGPLFYPW